MSRGKRTKSKTIKEKALSFLPLGIGMLTGLMCGLAMIRLGNGSVIYSSSLWGYIVQYAVLLLLLLVILFLHTTIHEVGHLVCGLLTGYRFCSYRIKNVMLIRVKGVYKLKRYALPGALEQCIMAPPDMADGKMPYMLYYLGGSLFHLLLSMVGFIGALFCKEGSVMLLFCMGLGMIGIAYALVNVIPMQLSEGNNDGYNIRAIIKHPEEKRALWIQMKVMEQLTEGVRLKDMPEEWFTLPSDEEMQSSICSVLGALACSRLMDRMQLQEADALMKRMLEMETGMPRFCKNLLLEDRIYCELVGENNLQNLLELKSNQQAMFEEDMADSPYMIRVRYAYNLLSAIAQKEEAPDIFSCMELIPTKRAPSGDEMAMESKSRFEKCARTYPYTGQVESQRELMAYADVQKEMLRERIRLEKSGGNE